MTKAKKNFPPVSEDGTVAQEFITVDDRAADAHYDHKPGPLHKVFKEVTRFLFQSRNGISLEIIWLGERLIRFRYSLDGIFDPDFSYAVDPSFQSEQGLTIHFEESGAQILLASNRLRCIIEKPGLRVHLTDGDGRWICKEKHGFYGRSTILRGKIRLGVSKELPGGDHFFGLGDKTGDLCLNGQVYENWNTDAYSFGAGSDPLYKSIPFFYGLHENRAYGIFLDNTYRTRFDFGKSGKDEFRFEAE